MERGKAHPWGAGGSEQHGHLEVGCSIGTAPLAVPVPHAHITKLLLHTSGQLEGWGLLGWGGGAAPRAVALLLVALHLVALLLTVRLGLILVFFNGEGNVYHLRRVRWLCGVRAEWQ